MWVLTIDIHSVTVMCGLYIQHNSTGMSRFKQHAAYVMCNML